MKHSIKLAGLAMAIGLASMGVSANTFQEGVDYRVLDNPETISGNAIIVRAFFWYGCPHCYNLEPHLENWAKTRAPDVAFFHTPAAMNPTWEASARGFYAAQEMGYQQQTHRALYDAIHKDGKKLFDQNSLADWYASQGLDRNEFNRMYNSFAVSTKIGRSQNGARRYQLTGTPAVVVQGKYVVQGSDAKVTQVVDYLVNKVRNER